MLEKKIAEWKIEFVRYMKLGKYAKSSIDTYWGAVLPFIWHFKTCELHRLSVSQIGDYILRYDNARTMGQKRYAIQLFYKVCIHQEDKLISLPTAKRPSIIPQVLTIDECVKLFMSIKSLKHRIIMQLSYVCALRRGELLNIRIRHIDGSAKRLFIEQSKGAKDRVVPIPEDTLVMLREYFKIYFKDGYEKDDFLFQGQSKNHEGYSSGSLYAILKRAVKKAGILKKIKFHSLRHSRATHWHNSKVMTLRDIADLLGHSNTKTTEIYIHTGNEDLQDKTTSADEIIKSKISPETLALMNRTQKQLPQ